MAIKKERCTECNGSGTVLKHMYSSGHINGSVNHGPGQVSCPGCYGRGYRDVVDNGAVDSDTHADNQANRDLELASSWYSMLCVLAFVGAVMYGIGLFEDSTSPIAVKIKTEYIGSTGYVSEAVGYTSITFLSLVVGILTRHLLRWVGLFGIIGFSGWLIYQMNR